MEQITTKPQGTHLGSLSKKKVSKVNLKLIARSATPQPFSELEYVANDPLSPGWATVTWWIGTDYDNCESRWEIQFKQARQKKFEIPGVPYKFMLVNGEIYYRRNVEEGA